MMWLLLLPLLPLLGAEPLSVFGGGPHHQLLHYLPDDLAGTSSPQLGQLGRDAAATPFFGALPLAPAEQPTPQSTQPVVAYGAAAQQKSAPPSALQSAQAVQATKLRERFSWRSLDFAFPDERSRQLALQTGGFVPENNLPVGIEVWGDKLFVTVPRWRSGVPSTLNYISLSVSYTDSPRLVPYPDWKSNIEGNCGTGVTTAYRIKADSCNRLWVLDTGTVGIGNTTRNVCPYAVVVYDLVTDRLLRRYPLRAQDTNANTFIANIAVDVGRSCEDTFLYASDELGYGLIVYSWELNTSWRVQHGYFLPDPLKGDFNVAGLNFQWFEEGIFGMALSPPKVDGFRTLYFSPLASNREFAVSTRILRDKAMAESEESYHQFLALANRGPATHTTAQTMDSEGVLFYNLVDQNAVGCWNSRLPFTRSTQGVLDRDDIGLVFPSDVKIDDQRTLWVMSDRMPVFLISNSIDFKNDVNFRIYSAPVADLIRGTVCDVDGDDQANTVLPEDDAGLAGVAAPVTRLRAFTAPPPPAAAPAAPAGLPASSHAVSGSSLAAGLASGVVAANPSGPAAGPAGLTASSYSVRWWS